MSDLLLTLANDRRTGKLLSTLGMPTPPVLARVAGGYEEKPLAARVAVLGGDGRAQQVLRRALEEAGARLNGEAERQDVLVFDATRLRTPADLRRLHDFFHPRMRRIARHGRILVCAEVPENAADPVASAVARGIEGFVRSLGKEIGRRGATANLAYVEEGAEERLDHVVRFFASGRTAYVDGQSVRVTSAVKSPGNQRKSRVLEGKVALVTGAARGIGEATSRRLAEDGAHVVCLDVPRESEALQATANAVRGTALTLDIAAASAPGELATFLRERFGGVDVVVHNAGITRDRTLANMTPEEWDAVLAVNLGAIVATDRVLLADGLLRDHGRVVCLSSIGGIAGNFGQTNYATSKAALIGYVAAQAPRTASRGITWNAAAPGFIETRMTAKIPFVTREAGRRMNSLQQGGLPRDVAELVAFFASPDACGITGQTVRVCGQALLGA